MIKKNALFLLSSEFFSKGTSFLSILIIAHFFSKEIFGLLVLHFAFFELLTIVISNGVTASARIDYFEKEESIFFKTYQAHLINSFLKCSLILILGLIFFQNHFIEIISLSLAAFLRTVFLLVLAILQCRELAKDYFKLNVFQTILFNSSFIIFLFLDFTIMAWVYAILISYFFIGIVSFMFFLRNFVKSTEDLQLSDLKKQFLSGITFFPQNIGFWSRTGTERFYLSIFLPLSVLGVYSFNFQLSLPIVIFGNAINIYLTPIIAKKINQKKEKTILSTTRNYTLLLIFVSFLNIFCAFIISRYFFFEKYFESFYINIWTSLINLFYVLMLLFVNPLYYLGRKKIVSNLIFVYGVFISVFNFFAIKFFEIQGLIIFNTLTNFIFLIVSHKLLLKSIHAFKH